MFFDSDNRAGLLGCRDDGLTIQRLDRRHIHHPGRKPVGVQQPRRLQSARDHGPAGDQRDVASLPQDGSPACLKAVSLRVHVRHRHAAHTEEDRPFGGGDRRHGLARLQRIGRNDDGQIRDDARPGEILDRVVRRAERAVGQPARHAAHFDVALAVAEVDLHLFHSARREKTRRAAHEGDFAGRGQSGAHADQVLLGDAHVDEALRKALAEAGNVGRADRIVGDRDHAGIGLGQRLQRLSKGLAAIVERAHGNVTSSSRSAIASSRSDGT